MFKSVKVCLIHDTCSNSNIINAFNDVWDIWWDFMILDDRQRILKLFSDWTEAILQKNNGKV